MEKIRSYLEKLSISLNTKDTTTNMDMDPENVEPVYTYREITNTDCYIIDVFTDDAKIILAYETLRKIIDGYYSLNLTYPSLLIINPDNYLHILESLMRADKDMFRGININITSLSRETLTWENCLSILSTVTGFVVINDKLHPFGDVHRSREALIILGIIRDNLEQHKDYIGKIIFDRITSMNIECKSMIISWILDGSPNS